LTADPGRLLDIFESRIRICQQNVRVGIIWITAQHRLCPKLGLLVAKNAHIFPRNSKLSKEEALRPDQLNLSVLSQ
jgi:hypothetical protein